MHPSLQKILAAFRNKYLLTFAVFVVWMVFFDNHNILDRLSNYRDIYKMKQQKEYYQQKIKSDKARLDELRSNAANLEKFAREQYLMKRADEEIFVILPE